MMPMSETELLKPNADARICAIIVTYNPAPELTGNVSLLLPQVDEVVIVDNGSGQDGQALLDSVTERFGCRIIRNGQNLGIAAALNIGVRHALAAGYPWVATFDQDSTVTDGFIPALLMSWQSCPFRDRVALVSPKCRDKATGALGSYAAEVGNGSFSEIENTITSGNLVRSDVFSRVGLFAEPFFMDCVDHEFCLRLRREEYRLIESSNAILQHSLGSMTQHRLLGRPCKVYNHSPLRRYYNARNRLVVYRRYLRHFPRWIVRDLGNFFREIAGIILFERDRFAKLAAIGRGLLHGLCGKMGKAF